MTSRFGGYEDQQFIAEFYDLVYEYRGLKDADFFVGYSKKAGRRTLELGCGTGRILVPTAVSGCQITGLDLSPYMLKKCQGKLDEQPGEVRERVRLIQGDMTSFDTGEMYSLVTIPFRAFQHLVSIEEQMNCLNCVSQHLSHQGLLITDIFNPFPPATYDKKYMTEIEDFPETRLPDGRSLRRATRIAAFHRHRQINDIEMIHYISHPDGRKEKLTQAFPFRYFYRYEFEHLLTICGFRVVDLFGDFDRSEFTSNSPEMIFVAEKESSRIIEHP